MPSLQNDSPQSLSKKQFEPSEINHNFNNFYSIENHKMEQAHYHQRAGDTVDSLVSHQNSHSHKKPLYNYLWDNQSYL